MRLGRRRLETLIGGIEDKTVVNEAATGVDYICHFAYTFSNDLNVCRQINVTGARNLLEAAEKEGVKHFRYSKKKLRRE